MVGGHHDVRNVVTALGRLRTIVLEGFVSFFASHQRQEGLSEDSSIEIGTFSWEQSRGFQVLKEGVSSGETSSC